MADGVQKFSSGVHKPEDAVDRPFTRWSDELVKVAGSGWDAAELVCSVNLGRGPCLAVDVFWLV